MTDNKNSESCLYEEYNMKAESILDASVSTYKPVYHEFSRKANESSMSILTPA